MRIRPRASALSGSLVAVAVLVFGAAGCAGPGGAGDPLPDPVVPSSSVGPSESQMSSSGGEDGDDSNMSGGEGGDDSGGGDSNASGGEDLDDSNASGGEGGDDLAPVGSPPTDTGGTADPSPELTEPPYETPCEGAPTPATTCPPSPEVTPSPVPAES